MFLDLRIDSNNIRDILSKNLIVGHFMKDKIIDHTNVNPVIAILDTERVTKQNVVISIQLANGSLNFLQFVNGTFYSLELLTQKHYGNKELLCYMEDA